AFHEVIDRAEGDDTIAPRVQGESHVREVRSGKELRLGIAPDARAFLDDANERLSSIRIAVDLPERLLVDRGGRVDVRRRTDAAHELDRGHRQIDAGIVATRSQLLLDLGCVAVPDRSEGAHHAGALGVVAVLARLAPALAR